MSKVVKDKLSLQKEANECPTCKRKSDQVVVFRCSQCLEYFCNFCIYKVGECPHCKSVKYECESPYRR